MSSDKSTFEPVYMSDMRGVDSWSDSQQVFLGSIEWATAVKIAKAHSSEFNVEVRLCNSRGFNNQGYYIRASN